MSEQKKFSKLREQVRADPEREARVQAHKADLEQDINRTAKVAEEPTA